MRIRISTVFYTVILLLGYANVKAQYWNPGSGGIFYNGNVGIGTSSVTFPLTVETTNTNSFVNIASFKNNAASNTWLLVANNTGQVNLGVGSSTQAGYIWSSTGKFFIGDDGSPVLYVDKMSNGNVGIGTTDTKGYKLAVNGNAVFAKAVVKLPGLWPDYVFHSNYRLRPLSEVEEYIKQYHHLPEVPSAEEVKKNGLDIGDSQATLLKKLEEMTLYMIEQNKKILELETKVKALEEKK
jgi:hypothetical protein